MNTITLVEVINALIDKKYKNDQVPEWDEFYRQQTKNFKDILKTLDLTDAIIYMKNQSGNYSFDEQHLDFLVNILLDYTGKDLKRIRKGHFKEVQAEYIVYIVEGFIEIIKKKIIDESERKQIILKMYNRTNYPLRKREHIISKMNNQLGELINYVFDENVMYHLSKEDKYTWLTAMQKDLGVFIQKWDNIYFNMQEARNEEISDDAFDEVSHMTKEEHAKLHMRINIDLYVEKMLEKHEEYKMLDERRNRLLTSNKGFIKDKEKEFQKIVSNMNEINNKIWWEVKNKLYPDIILKPLNELEDNNYNYKRKITSNDLLNIAIQEYAQ